MTHPTDSKGNVVSRRTGARTKAGTIVLSSRIRLARNVEGHPFPDWSTGDRRAEVFRELEPSIIKAGRLSGTPLSSFPLEACRDTDFTGGLRENNMISQQLIDRDGGAGFFLEEQAGTRKDSRLVVMVNEEDHLRIQVFREDDDLEAAWRQADRFDSNLDRLVRYAFSDKLGYLTSCPSNLGTAMRASVMLYLPALQLLDDFEPSCRSAQALGLNVRGRNGEGTAASAGIVQISNMGTLGRTEEEVIASLRKVSGEIIRLEIQARRYLVNKAPVLLNDLIARSLSLLQTAWLLQSEEAFQALHCLRLGVELGLVRGITTDKIGQLLETTGQCHVRQMMLFANETPAVADDPDLGDAFRATIVRAAVARAKMRPLKPVWD